MYLFYNSIKFTAFILWVISPPAEGQNPSVATPSLTPAIKESSDGYSQFLDIWELSLRIDSSTLQKRENIEPKTLLLPGDASMARLVPLDGSHPLFLRGEKFGKLRQKFILDHLILQPINIEKADRGILATTLSGKNVLIQRDASGSLYVNGVRVKKRVSLADGHDIFVLNHPLFNQTAKIREAFNKYHNIEDDAPVGPPLDIPDSHRPPPIPTGPSVIRAPAPPNRIAKPPAPPTISSSDAETTTIPTDAPSKKSRKRKMLLSCSFPRKVGKNN